MAPWLRVLSASGPWRSATHGNPKENGSHIPVRQNRELLRYERSPDRRGTPSAEVPVNWSKWIRQIHRWLSIVFTITVIANFVAMSQGEPPPWVTYSPLLPLALLLFTGLYLFVLPYATRWRSGRRAD